MSSGVTRPVYAQGYSVQQVLQMSDAQFCSVMESDGIRYFLDNLPETSILRAALNAKILSCRLSARLATDVQGNRLMQRLIEHAGAYVEDFLEAILDDLEELACDRYASRVVQKLLDFVPLEQVSTMVAKLVSNGVSVLTHHYGSFVCCHVINHFDADIIAPIVDRLQTPESAYNVTTNKYGSRVVQHLLRRLPELASGSDSASLATILTDKVVTAIVAKAPVLVSNEFGNFIVSQVIKSDKLAEYRSRIINVTICGNILSLSQEKFASHVVEQALQSAEPRVLAVLITELLQGYEPDFRNRDALDILIVNQYGNYVVQSALEVCIDVLKGKREGKKTWFFALRKKILALEKIIEQYTSGKKILQMIDPYRFLPDSTDP
ncbi:pumilio-family RNA binding repeat containing protein [Aphelenchoides avenae]|nr:pumilio-family RNA binding repeat containing protein [Aphelenchus avenae]